MPTYDTSIFYSTKIQIRAIKLSHTDNLLSFVEAAMVQYKERVQACAGQQPEARNI